MKKKIKKIASALGSPSEIRSVIFILTGVFIFLFISPARADIPEGWPWKIKHLVYPTLGQPVIIKKGETFTLEFDFIGKGEAFIQPNILQWNVTLSSSNDRWPTETECVVESATDGISERWPGDSTGVYWEGSGPWAGREVWKVTVGVPIDTRSDLYDLRVTADSFSTTVSDSQPHAVQVIDEFKDDYTFIQITDFHINDPRGPASWIELPEPHPNSEEFRDYKYNLKAIDCVNLLNPDFVIMSGDTVFGIPFFVEYPWAATGITDFTGTTPDWNGEYNKAYEQLLRLNMPIVCLPGNHDSYNMEIYNIVASEWTGLEGHAKQDGAEIWPTIFSPRYFGWDYGDKVHFTCIWSYDKEAKVFNPFEQNARNFLSGAWLFPEAEFPQNIMAGGRVQSDQMTWIGEDLQNAQGQYDLLAMASHHPFFGDYGEGDSFDDTGNRDELIALSHQTGVRIAISGHTHVDNFFVDTAGPEDIIHLNTTSTTFNTKEYPGFRPISVSGGFPHTYYYQFNSQTACYSYPTYKDTILKKHSDPVAAWAALTHLHTPSVEGWFSSTAPGAIPKDYNSRNNLTEGDPPVSLDNTVIDFLMPDLGDPDIYQITNGILVRCWYPQPGYLLLQVRIDTIPPGGEQTTTVNAVIPSPEHVVLQSGDYDGDGISEIAVFRPHTGLWAIKDITRLYFGGSNDLPVPGDYDGDGCCDVALFNEGPGRWAVKGITLIYFGTAGDRPVPGDYEGGGYAEIAVFRPSTGLWAVRGFTRVYYGQSGDKPLPGVYEWYGPGLTTGIINEQLAISNDQYYAESLSNERDGPFPSQIAVYRPATGLWAVRGFTRFYYGKSGDTSLVGDFDNNSLDDTLIFRPSTGLWAVRGLTRIYFGSSADMPVTR